jgi:hypothetical protein
MHPSTIDEQAILKELHQIPEERWGEVLTFLRSVKSGRQPPTADHPVFSGRDLAGSHLIGVWADRTEIKDSQEFARQLRHQAEHRRGTTDATGY